MASDQQPEKNGYGENSSANPDISAAEAALKAKLARKRTKTGCLTCRKRRIKCGEERPVCNNCIKSKRQCEGYTQRVIFKQPTFDFQPFPSGGANITFQAGSLPGPIVPFDHEYGQAVVDPSFYTQIHPRFIDEHGNALPYPGERYNHVDARHAGAPMLPYVHSGVPQPRPHAILPAGTPYQHTVDVQNSFHSGPEHTPHTFYSTTSPNFAQHVGYAAHLQPHSAIIDRQSAHHVVPQLQQAVPGVDETSPSSSVSSRTLAPSGSSASENWIPVKSGLYVPRPELCRPIDYRPAPQGHSNVQPGPPVTTAPVALAPKPLTPDLYEYEPQLPVTYSTNHFLSQAAVETHDEEYYDVRSDEEMDGNTFGLSALDHQRQRDLHRTLNMSMHDLQTRRHDNFIYDGILDHYRVEDAANPLKNPATARVFAHFISVTGPSLSIFERHPRNASLLFTDGQIPLSQQGLWTYTMPVAALHNQGLLHSMLALASLHIARLQNASDTPSRQHYAWACKRINHLLGPNSTKRHKTTTIAASMLLGFYEIFTADHRAWNLHLSGSRQLFLETDFTTLMRQFVHMKRQRAAQLELTGDYAAGQSQHEVLDQIHDVDESIISQLVGRQVRYDDDNGTAVAQSDVLPQMDVNNFEVLKDLYWWYLKQDAYQSLISGTPLLLDYKRWANCPPRAPIGRPDAVYGSFDHLILLLGRIADFSAKDRKRKLRQMEANGGEWRPAPGMKMPGNPRSSQSLPPTPSTNVVQSFMNGMAVPTPPLVSPAAIQQPQFFGMAPPPRQNVQMPSAYGCLPNVSTSLPASPQEEMDLTTATHAALEEYGRIRAALHKFEDSLGEAFKPLASEFQPPLETPFGNALFYRSFDIANLWAVYYMTMIIAIRSHPHQHPAAHAAAGIAAQETAYFANKIGRINAAIVPGPPDQPLNPTLSAALSDSCVPAFVAAIQYQDPQQRYMTVMRIHSIALRTGWGTAEVIANGCETAWVKAAAAGRGPTYNRVVRPETSDDPRLNGRWETLDPHGVPDEKDESDRRLVNIKADARLMWAIGLLGTEQDERPT